MKLSVALAAVALTAASATVAAAGPGQSSAYSPIPGQAKETAQLIYRPYMQCIRRGYRICALRYEGRYHLLAICRRDTKLHCKRAFSPRRSG